MGSLKKTLILAFVIGVILINGCSSIQSVDHSSNKLTLHTQTSITFPIAVNSKLYTILSPPGDKRFIHVIETSRGLVWNPIPKMENNSSAVPSLITPFSLYLSPTNTKNLEAASAERILTLPLSESLPGGQFYVYLGSYFSSENWVIYSVSLISPGMAQASSSELRGFNIDDKNDILITRFHDTGGYFFSVASDKNLILFSQKSPGSGATYVKQIYIFNLNNGKIEQVDPKDLNEVPEEKIVIYRQNGRQLIFRMQLDTTTFQ